MSDYRTHIGQLITTLRIRNHMTQAELAKQLETSQSAINRIEKGAQNVSLDILSRLSQVLGCDIINIGKQDNLSLLVKGGNNLATPSPVPDVDDMSLIALATAALITRSEIVIRCKTIDISGLTEQYFSLIKQLRADYSINYQTNEIGIKPSALVCPKLLEISAQQVGNGLIAIIPILVSISGVSIVYDLSNEQSGLVSILKQFSITHSFHNGTLIANGGDVLHASKIEIANPNDFPLAVLLSLMVPQGVKLYDLANNNYKYNELYKNLRLYSVQIETLHEI